MLKPNLVSGCVSGRCFCADRCVCVLGWCLETVSCALASYCHSNQHSLVPHSPHRGHAKGNNAALWNSIVGDTRDKQEELHFRRKHASGHSSFHSVPSRGMHPWSVIHSWRGEWGMQRMENERRWNPCFLSVLSKAGLIPPPLNILLSCREIDIYHRLKQSLLA